jgi:hypothetical protein
MIGEGLDQTLFHGASFDIWERVAPQEYWRGNTSDQLLDPRRWIAVQEDHAGADDEKVLYRRYAMLFMLQTNLLTFGAASSKQKLGHETCV